MVIKLEWMDIIRDCESKNWSAERIIKKLKRYGNKLEFKIDKGFKTGQDDLRKIRV